MTPMDPITAAFVTALASGVLKGTVEVGKGVVLNAYNALMDALKQKCGEGSKVVKAVEELKENPQSKNRQGVLEEEVASAKAHEDPDLKSLAEKLIAALQDHPEGQEYMSKYNIQISGGQVGAIGDNLKINGGINFGAPTNPVKKLR